MADQYQSLAQIKAGGKAEGVPELLFKLIQVDTIDGVPVYAWPVALEGGGSGVSSVVAGDGVDVDDSDPSNPVVGVTPTVLRSRGVWSGGSVAGFGTGRYVGIGRSFANSVSNTDPVKEFFATVANADGTLKKLTVLCSGTATGSTNTYTVYKNGIATALTVTITTGNIGSDDTHSVDFLQGDILMIGCVAQSELDLACWTVGYEFDID